MGIVMFQARLVALLSAVLTLWAVGVPGPRYFCRMMDRVLDECCCPSEPALDAVKSEPEARSADCCVRLAQDTTPVAASRPEGVKALSVAGLPGTTVFEIAPAMHRDAPDTQLREGGSRSACGPPLFLKNCQLLI